jgi:hypothetical protein
MDTLSQNGYGDDSCHVVCWYRHDAMIVSVLMDFVLKRLYPYIICIAAAEPATPMF